MKKGWVYIAVILLIFGSGAMAWLVLSSSRDNSVHQEAYLACGCGGCGGHAPRIVEVADRSTFDDFAAQDRQLKDSASCATRGCSLCIEYRLVEG